jgi:Mannosyltransferase (PIG-V)
VAGTGLLPPVARSTPVPGWPAIGESAGWHNVYTAWEQWDALWFLRIATSGYSANDASGAFFPLYPLAVRALSVFFGGNARIAAHLVSNAACLAALALLYLLTRTEVSEGAARRSVVYLAVFPTAFFLLAPYSESLFLFLVLLSFWGARRRRWWIAGLAGALAALTRAVGGLLVLALAVEAILQFREGSREKPTHGSARSTLARLAWSLGPVGGTLLYLWFWGQASGDWLTPLRKQGLWGRELQNPLFTLGSATAEAFRGVGLFPQGLSLLDWLLAVPVLIAAVYAVWRFRPSYATYTAASILLPLAQVSLSFAFAGRPLVAFGRYSLTIFPLYWAIARWTEGHRGRHEVVLAASATMLGVTGLLFVNAFAIL